MTPAVEDERAGLQASAAVWLFLSFAFAYFFSALLRGVTATLAPSFSAELGLGAADLGLLAGAYFFGFALTQLPLGSALDRIGSRRVLIGFLLVAVAGCAAFALARSFFELTLARTLIGVGVSACLMAPMTTFRHRFGLAAQLRATSWMMMTGSLGMVASTLPVQWLLPIIGWRGLFWAIAAALALATVAIAWCVPRDAPASPRSAAAEPGGPGRESDTGDTRSAVYAGGTGGTGGTGVSRPAGAPGAEGGYREIFQHRTFQRFGPLGCFLFGGLIAVQSLWAGPWLVEVSGESPASAASGLFVINVAMLAAFLTWGLVVPRLYARGWSAQRFISWGGALALATLVLVIWLGPRATAWHWALFCASSSVSALAQPAVAQAFPAVLAGRALTAYNLVIFVGVFAVQWGLGLAIDAFRRAGWEDVSAYRGAFALLLCCCLLSYLWFLWRDDPAVSVIPEPSARTVDNPPPCPD